MLARRVCALAAQRHARRAAAQPPQLRWKRLHSSSPTTNSSSATMPRTSLTSATQSEAAQQLAKQTPLNLDGVSDRELIRRLLTRPQRVWFWIGGVVVVGVTLMAFAPELKLGVSKHTADVASKSLQDETLQGHTRELASQIVQTVLNDPNVLDQASRFLQRLVVMDTTRDALRSLIVHTLNDPVTLAHVSKLAKQTVVVLLEDPTTRRQVVDLLMATVVDPKTKQSVLLLIEQLMKDEQTRRNLTQLLAHTFVQDPVKKTVTSTLGESVHDVLSRVDIQNHAKQFVGTVVKDQTVQAQSGDAIWSTFMYAVTPGWLSWIWQPAGTVSDEQRAAELAASIEKVVVIEETHKKSSGPEGNDGAETAIDDEETVKDIVVVTRKVPVARSKTKTADKVAGAAVAVLKEGEEQQQETEEEDSSSLRKRMTARLPFARRKTIVPSSTATQGSSDRKSDASPSTDPEFTDEYEKRHWSGSGSGFL